MIFLYAIDVVAVDGFLSGDLSAVTTDGARSVYLLTNSERAVQMPSVSSFWSSFFPAPSGSDVVTGPDTRFVPTPGISHSGVSLDAENNAGEISFTLPAEHAIAQLFLYDAPAAQLWLTVYAYDDIAGVTTVQWTGQISSCAWQAPLAKLKGVPLSGLLRRQGLTRKHPRTCGHALYGPAPGCGVNRNDYSSAPGGYFFFREDGFLAEVTNGGLTLVVPEAANRPAGFFDEGLIAVQPAYAGVGAYPHLPRARTDGSTLGHSGPALLIGGYRRGITRHAGAELHLSAPLLAPLVAPVRVSVFAGCDLLPATCQAKFNNFPRFGGYPYIPIKNAFESGLKG
jgi:hypothetical protein